MYKTTRNWCYACILAMIICPVLSLMGMMQLVPNMAAWEMLLVAVGAVWLGDLAATAVTVVCGKMLNERVQRSLVVLNIGVALAPWVCEWHSMNAIFALWMLFAVIGGVAAISLTTVMDELGYVASEYLKVAMNLVSSECRKTIENSQENGIVVKMSQFWSDNVAKVSQLRQRSWELAKNMQKGVWAKMATLVERGRSALMEAVVPTRNQIYELNELIEMIRKESANDEQLERIFADVVRNDELGLTDETVSVIAEEISANLATADLDQEALAPPELQASVSHAIDESRNSSGNQQAEGGRRAANADGNTFVDRRHPDLSAMRKRHSNIQTCLSMLLGSMLGIIGTMLLAPLRGAGSMEMALLVGALLVAISVALKICAQYVVAKERLKNWTTATTLVALTVGAFTEVMQRMGLLDVLTLAQFGAELGGFKVVLVIGAILIIYYMVCGIIYRKRCDEAAVAAIKDATEIMSNTDEVELADSAGYGQGALLGSLSLRQTVRQFWLNEFAMSRAGRVA